jgi:uncharacterized protein YggT (Ycf19 family)
MVFLKTFYAFIIFFEIVVIMYIFATWLFRSRTISKYLREFLAPILEPLDRLTTHSIMYMPIVELSPILFLIVLIYIEQILVDLF